MSLWDEWTNIPDRLRRYVEQLVELLREHDIDSIRGLVRAVRDDPGFRQRWNVIWADIAGAEGGKVSFTTMGLIIGATLGGVGIAAMGSAIGVPLFAVLGLAGFVAGTEFDARRFFGSDKTLLLSIPRDLYRTIDEVASQGNVKVKDLIRRTLEEAFGPARDAQQ